MPHWGYQIIKSWLYRKEGFVFTSNVDGHLRKSVSQKIKSSNTIVPSIFCSAPLIFALRYGGLKSCLFPSINIAATLQAPFPNAQTAVIMHDLLFICSMMLNGMACVQALNGTDLTTGQISLSKLLPQVSYFHFKLFITVITITENHFARL